MPVINSKYETNEGEIHPIRIDSTRVGTFNPAPAGATTSDISAVVSRGRRALGLLPRTVSLSRRVGTAPNQGVRYARLPVLTEATWNSLSKDDTIAISGTNWTVVSKTPEFLR